MKTEKKVVGKYRIYKYGKIMERKNLYEYHIVLRVKQKVYDFNNIGNK